MSRRPGFSLIELLIVVAIMVAISALGVISIRAMYPSYKLNGAVDSVRTAWALARSWAADEDRSYRFSIEPGGRHFRVEPDTDDADDKGHVHTDALPAGVRFVVNGEPGQPPPADAAVADEKTPASGEWEAACVIRPDGTSPEDVRIVFHVAGGTPTQLELRGLTGVSYVTKLK